MVDAWYMHIPCTHTPMQCIHHAFAMHMPRIYTVHAPDDADESTHVAMHIPCIYHACCMYHSYTLCIPCIYTVHTMHAHLMMPMNARMLPPPPSSDPVMHRPKKPQWWSKPVVRVRVRVSSGGRSLWCHNTRCVRRTLGPLLELPYASAGTCGAQEAGARTLYVRHGCTCG